jgi:hypothetical protein
MLAEICHSKPSALYGYKWCAVTSLIVMLMLSDQRGNCRYLEWIFYSELVFAFKFLAGNTARIIIFRVSLNFILSGVGVRTLRFDNFFY